MARNAHSGVFDYPVTEEAFGELLRRLRDRRGLSQEAFADAVGLSRKTIYAIENDRSRPSFKNEIAVVTKMAEVLDIPVPALSTKLGWMPAGVVDWEAAIWSEPGFDVGAKEALILLGRAARTEGRAGVG